mgnify:FL=1|jgi:hypothetical protein
MLVCKKIHCAAVFLFIIAAASALICTACQAQPEVSFAELAGTKDIAEIGTEENTIDNNSKQEQAMQGILPQPVFINTKNTYQTLNVATYITKIDDLYFIADCYHNQILYHNILGDPLTEWQVLTDKVHYAHTIAADEEVLLVDDTENNRVLVFQNINGQYAQTQTLENIGLKPHYIQYDAQRNVFMVWSSITGEMYFLKRADTPDDMGIFPIYIEKILKIEELYGVYVRSFTIMEDGIYFVSGHNNQKIIKAKISPDGNAFTIKASYAVPDKIAGMVQLTKIDDYYYITVSTDNQENQEYATIVRCKDLEALEQGSYQDIYSSFGISGGTPYYITQIEGRYYMAHHRTNENIIAFDIIDNEIRNVKVIY